MKKFKGYRKRPQCIIGHWPIMPLVLVKCVVLPKRKCKKGTPNYFKVIALLFKDLMSNADWY